MRQVILLMHLSLDGMAAGPDGAMDWVAVDDDVWREVLALQERVDTALFGRVNYLAFEGYWPSVSSDPNASAHMREHARWLDRASKIVFSRTLDRVSWKHASIASAPPAREVAALKQQPGRDLLLFGGVSLAQAFVTERLVDELQLLVNPVILGRGSRLFAEIPQRLPLRLLEAKHFRSGVTQLRYVMARP